MQKTISLIHCLVLLLCLTIQSCLHNHNHSTPKSADETDEMGQMIQAILSDMQWINEPSTFEIENGTLKVEAEKNTDFFNNPEDSTITSSAPFLYKEISGDFVATSLVRPDFSSMWNAIALMVHIDNDNWIKFAFENSDATGNSIISVVTKGVSDDANGAILEDQDKIWLKLIRKENIYSMLWSMDGKDYKMTRLTTLNDANPVKVGLEFQCPVAESAKHAVDYFQVEKTTVKNLRQGI